MNAYSMKIRNALILSKQSNVESKLTSLLLALRLYDEVEELSDIDNNPTIINEKLDSIHQLLTQVTQNVGLQFMRSTLRSRSNDKSNVALQSIVIAVLIGLMNSTDNLQYLTDYVKDIDVILELYFIATASSNSKILDEKAPNNLSTSAPTALYTISPTRHPDMIKLVQTTITLGMESTADDGVDDIIPNTIHCILRLCNEYKVYKTSIIVDLIAYCYFSLNAHQSSFLASSPLPSLLSLSESERVTLRGLFVQGLHGAAPTSERQVTFKCLCLLLQQEHSDVTVATSSSDSGNNSSSGSATISSIGWTLEQQSSNDKSASSLSLSSLGQFASFLCSILRGEIHLAIEEIIDLFPPILIAPTVDNHTQINSNATTAVNGTSTAAVTRLDRTALTAMWKRYDTTCDMLTSTFLPMCESILLLLVGSSTSSGHDVTEEQSSPLWSTLSSDSLLKLQSHMYEALNELMDMIKWAYEQLLIFPEMISISLPKPQALTLPSSSSASSFSSSVTYSRSQVFQRLVIVVTQSVRCVCGWVIEDSSLHTVFVKHLLYMMAFSISYPSPAIFNYTPTATTSNINAINNNSSNNDSLSLLPLTLTESNNITTANDNDDRLQLLWRRLSKTHISDNTNNSNTNDDDVIEYLLPCILAVYDCNGDVEESTASKSQGFVTSLSTESLSEQVLNQKHFMTCLMNVIVHNDNSHKNVATAPIVENMTDNHTNNLLFNVARINHILSTACILLELLLQSKHSELSVLLPVEGLTAIGSVLGYSISLSTLSQLITILNEFSVLASKNNINSTNKSTSSKYDSSIFYSYDVQTQERMVALSKTFDWIVAAATTNHLCNPAMTEKLISYQY